MSETQDHDRKPRDEQTDNNPIGKAINGFADLYARNIAGTHYRVLSLRNDSVTAHKVDINDLSCTCADAAFNADAGRDEICDHVAVALHAAPPRKTLGEDVAGDIASARVELQDAVSIAEDAAATAEGVLTGARSEDASPSAAEPDDETVAASEPDGQAAAEAADRLQDAFDDVIDDMQVQASAGLVWFQTGKDTPDEWPFPGGDSTFDVVTGPDSVMFVHDGSADWADGPHERYDDKPGEWWKNALEPADVDDYVAEVLE